MDFLNDLGKRFTRVARSVQERTREGWESTRLSADLYSLRGDLERQYTALGEAYFKAVSAGEEVPEELITRVKATVDRIDELTALREKYNAINADYAQYAVSDPCYPFISETNVAFGSVLSTIISDAAVQYIAHQIDEDGLRAAWAQWSDEGGAQMTQEYNEAYHASLAE